MAVFIDTLCLLSIHDVDMEPRGRYDGRMPKLWNDTIDTHRQSVRDATLDATAALVAEQGLTAVTMSQIAKDAGIGRATLYKYFPDVEAILVAWHERMIARHMQQLHAAHEKTSDPLAALRVVLETYGHAIQAQQGHALAHLHSLPHAKNAEQHLEHFVRALVADAVRAEMVRPDISPNELAAYALAALSAAASQRSARAVKHLVELVVTGLTDRAEGTARSELLQAGKRHPKRTAAISKRTTKTGV
jgi:AcrR family transcriptional regulator